MWVNYSGLEATRKSTDEAGCVETNQSGLEWKIMVWRKTEVMRGAKKVKE